MKLLVFTAFSGYDSQCLGLNRLKEYSSDFDYELVGWSEIDKGAIGAHNALFPEAADKNYGDISKVDWKNVPDFDLFTYSSPCTDFSHAGLQKGGEEGSGTRSSLLWECRRTIEQKRPKYLLFENVIALVSNKFLYLFEKWIALVNSMGYKSYYQILNSCDYGVAQNRPRLFLVSIRNDVDVNYSFPAPIKERPHLYEMLEPDEDIDKKLFRSEYRIGRMFELHPAQMAALDDNMHGVEGKYEVMPCGLYCHSSDAFSSPPIYDMSRCLKAMSHESGIIYKKDGKWFERLFSKRECFRLMGLTDEEFDKIEKCVKTTDLYQCAGNSIVVNVLFHIFRKMFVDLEPDMNSQYVLF